MLLRNTTSESFQKAHESRIRFPALPDFLRSSGCGTGPLGLVSTIEEILERKIAAPV
jgi:hypothetical protein